MSVTSSPILSSDDAQLVRPGDPIDRGASADELIESCRDCLGNLLHDGVNFNELRDACIVEFDTLLKEGSAGRNCPEKAIPTETDFPSRNQTFCVSTAPGQTKTALSRRPCDPGHASALDPISHHRPRPWGGGRGRGGPAAQPGCR